MNNDLSQVRVIEFKDLLYRTAQKWRRIIIGAVIIALLAALWQVVSGLRVTLDGEELEEARSKYAIRLADYEAKGERLRTQIANLRDQSANQQEYNDKSLLMKIDPMNKWAGNFQFYIDSKYQIDPSLSYQNTDRTNRLIAAYASYLRSGELYEDILASVEGIGEIRFLTEIYDVSVDQGAATITVSVVGAKETEVRALLDFVKDKIAERYEGIRNTIGEHSYDVLTESVFSTIDLALDERQKSNLLAISAYANEIGEASEKLTEWEKTKKPQREFGTAYTVKQAVKSLIVGGIVGLVLLTVWYMAKYVLSNTMKTEFDWRSFRIPVLGRIRTDRRKRAFRGIDRRVDKLFGRQAMGDMEKYCALTAQNLEAALKAQGLRECAFIGDLAPERGQDMVRRMDKAADCRLRFAGDILREPEAAGRLEGAETVVLLGEAQVTRREDLKQMLTLLQTWNKTLLGVVVVE